MHPLISTRTLADRLALPHRDGPRLRLYDVTAHLRPATPGPWRVESGRADDLAAHIPGSTRCQATCTPAPRRSMTAGRATSWAA